MSHLSISLMKRDSIKPSLLFLNMGCCISKELSNVATGSSMLAVIVLPH